MAKKPDLILLNEARELEDAGDLAAAADLFERATAGCDLAGKPKLTARIAALRRKLATTPELEEGTPTAPESPEKLASRSPLQREPAMPELEEGSPTVPESPEKPAAQAPVPAAGHPAPAKRASWASLTAGGARAIGSTKASGWDSIPAEEIGLLRGSPLTKEAAGIIGVKAVEQQAKLEAAKRRRAARTHSPAPNASTPPASKPEPEPEPELVLDVDEVEEVEEVEVAEKVEANQVLTPHGTSCARARVPSKC